jgi:hypothetical protein
MSQDKMIPEISFEGPIMQTLDISLAYDPAILGYILVYTWVQDGWEV